MKFKIIFSVLVLLIIYVVGKGIATGTLNHNYKNELAALNATPTNSPYQTKCNRKTPPVIDPKMQTAINYWTDTLKGFGDDLSWTHSDCINVEYKDLGGKGTRGEFNPSDSDKTEDAVIYVDSSFEDNPVLTSVILMHEFTHLEEAVGGTDPEIKNNCVAGEVEAIHNQVSYMLKMKEADFKQANLEIAKMKKSKNVTISSFANEWNNSLDQINAFSTSCYKTAFKQGSTVFQNCIWNGFDSVVKKGVEASPFYQDNCKSGIN